MPHDGAERDRRADPCEGHTGDPNNRRRARRLDAGTVGRGKGAAAALPKRPPITIESLHRSQPCQLCCDFPPAASTMLPRTTFHALIRAAKDLENEAFSRA